jgi:hypothetical protein
MNYPVEKEGIRFYNYYYYGVDKPVIIEARSKAEARDILKSINARLSNKYSESKIIGESVVIPLRGVSEKVVKGVKYIWVGEDKAQGGWLSETAYKRAVAQSKAKARR